MPAEHRFCGELATWWPLISPPAEYVEEAAWVATVLGSASIPVREVLELGSGGGHSRGVRYLEWMWDPDPTDTWTLTEYAFLLRDSDDSVRAVHETHRTGLFSRNEWLRHLAAAGFHPDTATEPTTEDRTPRELFIGRRASA